MTSLDVLISVVGAIVTVLVVVGMVLITPAGTETANRAAGTPTDDDLARADADGSARRFRRTLT